MAPDRGTSDGPRKPDNRSHSANMEASIADELMPAEPFNSGELEQYQTPTAAQRILALRGSKPQNFTLRGVLLGLAIGVIICFSNTYFGLQTGWISGMSMPSALIGFAFFKMISSHIKLQFSPVENVLVQTVASSMGTMPLGCGIVGVVPALEYLLRPEENGPLNLGVGKLCIWAVGLCLFGVVFAVPLRKEVIIREKLKFPSGTATALMIGVLHGEKEDATILRQKSDMNDGDDENEALMRDDDRQSEDRDIMAAASNAELLEAIPNPARGNPNSNDWKGKISLLTIAFVGSATYIVVSYFLPQLRRIPVFGFTLAETWLWALNPSPAYVAQGIIMGPATTMHMLLGAVVGWGVLSPLAKKQGWAPEAVSDWNGGSKGWIVWVSLAIMLADSIISLAWLVVRPLIYFTRVHGPEILHLLQTRDWKGLQRRVIPSSSGKGYSTVHTLSNPPFQASSHHLHPPSSKDNKPDLDEPPEADAPPEHLLSSRYLMLWLVISLTFYFASIQLAFPSIIPFSATILALLLALVLSIMGVRALGETDLNPVSGISKLTQLVFAVIIPRSNPNAIIINLLAGAISEAGALQAGDLMQDLKTGHLLGAAPKAQFYGQVIGSIVGAVVCLKSTKAAQKLHASIFLVVASALTCTDTIPSQQFQVPTAYVWIRTARLVNGTGLPEMAGTFAIWAGAIFAILTAIRTAGQGKAWQCYIPGGIAVAVGMYNVPSFTLARTIGGLISWYWTRRRGKDETTVVILASGLILGEGLFSIVNLIMASLGVPHL